VKYESCIFYGFEVMSKVKVFVTDGQTDGGTEGWRDGRRDGGMEGRTRFNSPSFLLKAGDKNTSMKLCMLVKNIVFHKHAKFH